MTQAIAAKILSRIYGKGRGWSFSQADFADLAGATTINSVFRRLVEEGTIRRVRTGLYDYPRYSELLGKNLGPDMFQVASALARKFKWEIQPDGASALNLMGLSTQVPAQYLFHSDGPTREYEINGTKLRFRRVATREMKFKQPESAVIVHGLKSLGSDHIDGNTIAKVRDWLPESKRGKVLRDTQTVTQWIRAAIREICKEHVHG
jgi:uncharacterized protein (DUF2267 family)